LQIWKAAEVPGSIIVSKNWLCTYAKLEIGWQKQFADPRLAGIPHERRQGSKPVGLTLQPAVMQHAPSNMPKPVLKEILNLHQASFLAQITCPTKTEAPFLFLRKGLG
jgi:hypothetical protein